MLRSAIPVAFCFLLGFFFVAGASAHRIITTPLLPAVTEAQVDAGSVCAMANEMLSKTTNCKAFRWSKSVSFDMDSSVAQASKVCHAIAAQSSGFAGMGWTVQIYTPYRVDPEKCVLR